MATENVEPWLRGTLPEIDAVRRQVLHALELTAEEIDRWCANLTDAEINERPHGLPSVAFHLRHIARSLDRLLTYEAKGQLTDSQMHRLKTELDPDAIAAQVLAEVRAVLTQAAERIRLIQPADYEDPRGVGRALLPSTVGGLMVHCAEHTQRHAGQAITTAKVVIAMRTLLSVESPPL